MCKGNDVVLQSAFQEKFSFIITVRGLLGEGSSKRDRSVFVAGDLDEDGGDDPIP